MTSVADREIVSTRLLAAPREKVFAAFSDPKALAAWWGPKGFTNRFRTFEFKPGGTWLFEMIGPTGTVYENESRFVEIVRPERIVFDHLRTHHRFLMTITLADEVGKTRIVWRMTFETPAEREKVKAFVPEANEQNFDRLEAHLSLK
ncbi:MAG TPA: SRPBCC family protein [Candidatus Eisenbacteria bacterium]|jgi:uncharacterized protein YndB with AHSA1/START domain|nr:SRPBCC family protein [Candidatus Eisenbacteria bacterium]